MSDRPTADLAAQSIEAQLDELARALAGPLGTDIRVERIRSALPAAFREYRDWGIAIGRAASRPAVREDELRAALREPLIRAVAKLGHYDHPNTEPGAWWDKRTEPVLDAVLAALADKGSPAVGSAQPFPVTDDDLDAPDGTEMAFRRVRGSWEPIARPAVREDLRNDIENLIAYVEDSEGHGPSPLDPRSEDYDLGDMTRDSAARVNDWLAALADKGSPEAGEA